MTLHFYEPPLAQKVGGLDVAIQSLREFLEGRDIKVRTNAGLEQIDRQGFPQAVHFHGLWQPQFLKTSRLCRQLEIPYVVSPHGMLEPWAWRHKYWKKLPYYYFFERGQLRNARAVLATSQEEAQNLARFVPASRIRVIPLGLADPRRPGYVAAREKLGWRPDEVVLLFLSRIHPKKGLHLLVAALKAISGSLPAKWKLVVVGDGGEEYLVQCQNCARSNPIVARSIEWKGAVWGDEKWSYHQGADLFCLPSFSENFGLAILEAGQVGTRILTSRNTPWSFLEDGRSAFLVEPTVESVQNGLLAFLKSASWSHADRDDLAERIHGRFNWTKVGPRYVELYQEITTAPASSKKKLLAK